MNKKILFLIIFLLAAFFRLYGTNWDQGQHFHPDERFLTMVTQTIEWPKTISQYFDASTSPLNPHNKNFSFFVYGLFPLLVIKYVAEFFHLADYTNLTLVGRQLSGLVDLGTTVLVFLIGKQIITNYPCLAGRQAISTNKPINQLKDKKNWKLDNWIIPFLGMFFYAVSVLPIQLSHFYATDPYLTFFIVLTFYFGVKLVSVNNADKQTTNNEQRITNNELMNIKYTVLMGISFGLALASKISGALFGIIPIFFFLSSAIKQFNHRTIRNRIFKIFLPFAFSLFLFFSFSYLFLRIGSPYTFVNNDLLNPFPNPKVVDNWKQLESFEDPNTSFPPGIQWIHTKPYIFPLKNMVLWGLGLPLGILSVLAVSFFVIRDSCLAGRQAFFVVKRNFSFILNSKFLILNSSLLWVLLLFAYQGRLLGKALRYFYPFYPFLAILTGYFVYASLKWLLNKKIISPRIGLLGYWIIGLLLLVYPLSFMSIYTHIHTRVAASEWIYQNVPSGSFKSDELWDDGLPVSLGNNIHENYTGVEFPLYNPDSPEKWQDMAQKLQQVDYIFETSNRLYASIMTAPEKYPTTYKYYSMLFDGSLGFEKVAEFTSRPNLPIPGIHICIDFPGERYGIVAKKTQECTQEGISFVDDYADETFTVYDHPKVTIFKKVKSVNYLQLLSS